MSSDADQGWKPSGRPQSTMAQDFSSVLDSVFSLDPNVSERSQDIDNRRQQMMAQNRELEELQARIREAEARLKARQSIAPDGNHAKNKQQGGYHSGNDSASATTSPTDTAGQYSSGDEQQQGRGYGRQRGF